ncbi:hypothetical protein GUITHDRAFT_163753 [Guillardia theta CCMP2712]|uniref:Endoplasmic reticulum transmembrane protein n=2 Tax=Guillardia theta TaxID=55529 RepID=L1J661_GUITC|nr:hypothetical protein GUITHDRAFT_163753 [Guillardia theta CCMP2712]EKX43782.1 hypothetical protein GUITHDRAFT_163753 [Guillardia theta CCMP2712]|eukprot:XP_005830762.1 hypothetical protein GUITHDRAFT_163753 [Guillardia theta CCMP2712]
MYALYSYMLFGECAVCAVLMALSFAPSFIKRPMKSAIQSVQVPFSREIIVGFGVILVAAFADSYLKATKHRHPHTDGWKDKMEHQNKRLRAERNIYISFGCMFIFLVVCQLWSLIKRVTELEEKVARDEKLHEVYKKQVEGNEKFRKKLEGDKDADEQDTASELQRLKEENERLKEKLGMDDSSETTLRRRNVGERDKKD